jgi:signal-transduction protein with cAMP-binding, CBS, and nucleotidyltransferase domain
MQEPTVSDMSIADEHIVVEPKATVASIASQLASDSGLAVLVKVKGGSEIQGVVTVKDILSIIAEGKNPAKMKVAKVMRTNIITLGRSTHLSKALDIMLAKRPDALVIVDAKGDFNGYFSPSDYRDATRRLEAHQLMSVRLSRSKKVIAEVAAEEEPPDELLNLLLGGNDEEIVADELLGSITL